MKKITLFLIAMLCISLAGCSKDAEVNAFITEFEAATQDIIAKIDANPSAAGIDEAQKSFDGKKVSLKAKWEAIKGSMGEMSADTKKRLGDSMSANMAAFANIPLKHVVKLGADEAAMSKLKTLVNDYVTTFSVKK